VKKNRSTLTLVALMVLVAIGLPYYFSSQKAAALDLKTKAAHDDEKTFRDKSALGERIRKQNDEWKKSLDTLQAAMPAKPDIQGAIRTLQALADVDTAPDGVRWVSGAISGVATKAPAPSSVATTVVAKSGAPTTVAVAADPLAAAAPTSTGYDFAINVEGSRAKVLAFVTKIQQKPDALPRLFAVKSVTLSQASVNSPALAGSSSATTVPTKDGSEMVKAEIKLRVTGFGPPEVAAGPQTPVTAPIPAGPATSVASAPATSAPNP
jgi:hypothetical protein